MVEKSLKKPRQYTESEFALKKAEAEALFISGVNPGEIDVTLNLRSGRTAQWAHHGNWSVERQKVLDKTTKTLLDKLIQEHEETIEELKTIKEKAFDSIYTDDVQPRKFSEAANAYINAVDAMRRLRVDSIQACRELITDHNLLVRIGERFREIYNNHHQTNALAPGQKIVPIEQIEDGKKTEVK
jgi:hypothetical protein